MAAQVRFFKKNIIDLSNATPVLTVTDATATNTGQSYIDFMRNRNNTSAWVTTGSNDAANTTIEIDLVDLRDVTSIIMVLHNFDSYTLKYWDGSWVDFSTTVNVSGNAATTTFHEFTQVSTTKIQLVISGTVVANADKKMRQLIITENLVSGQLNGWPVFSKPNIDTNKKVSTMLSGKANVVESIGAYETSLKVDTWKDDADLQIVEEIYFGKRGVLVWPCGGDQAQFSSVRIGYRLEDIFLMRGVNNLISEWNKGLYTSGMKINMKLKEAIE